MRLRFVGCGDAFGSGGRYNTCFHVTGEKVNFLIDCGASSLPTLKRNGVRCEEIDLVLITHFHGDHFGGLPFLMLEAQFTRRTRPLVIAGPRGIEARLEQAMEALFENSSKRERRFELRIVTLAPAAAASLGEVEVTPFSMVHGDSGGPFLGYRIEVEGRIIAFTGDTEWNEALIPLGRDADLFISECYFYDKSVKNHLNLKTLQAHLAEIRPKRLILTHLGEDMLARLDTIAHETASDGLVIDI